MNKSRAIHFKGEAAGHAAAVSKLKAPGDVALDRRGVERSLVMQCPDGCGALLTINLDPRAGKAWRFDQRGGKLSLYPSVWRDDGCEAHFILWRDYLIWGDGGDTYRWHDEAMVAAVRSKLGDEYTHYTVLADAIGDDVIPWEVSWACQHLVRSGEAEVQKHSYYRRRKASATPKSGLWA